jgi:hypothetical protein
MIVLRWILGCLLAGIIVADGVLTALIWLPQSEVEQRSLDAVVRDRPTERRDAVLASGLTNDGSSLPQAVQQAPVVVRYAAQSCGYCARDIEWPQLAGQMRQRGVRVVVLLPRASERFSQDALVPSDAPQIAFISMEWMTQFRLTMTPTVMLYDTAGDLIWAQEGVLPPDSVARAVRALGATVQSSQMASRE